MTLTELHSAVGQWDLKGGSSPADSKYGALLYQLEYHSKNEWRNYVPALHPDQIQDFMERLATWIGNVPDEASQQLLLEYASYICFFSHADFQALYQSALNREVSIWVASQAGIQFDSMGLSEYNRKLFEEIHAKTWFCPVTDSMDINEFFKTNHLTGVGHRPTFAPLLMLSEGLGASDPQLAKNLLAYMRDPSLGKIAGTPSLERIVLLEDFVGSANQSISTIRWALRVLGKPILFIPLILCPNGASDLQELEENSNGMLSVRPIIQLSRSDLVGPERKGETGWAITPALENFVTRAASLYGQTGQYGFLNTGCSVATFANTPDNTLPIVHRDVTGGWRALFPRVYRGET